jgi:pyrimidine nucleoside transport protein
MVSCFSDECSVLDAATKGAVTAAQLVMGIIANVIAFVSFIAFLNGVLSWLGMLVGAEGLTFEVRFSYTLAN